MNKGGRRRFDQQFLTYLRVELFCTLKSAEVLMRMLHICKFYLI
jgi:hypothetical protein